MKRVKRITAEVNTFDIFGTTSRVEFPVYIDENEKLYIKVYGDYISIGDPQLTRNNIRILQPLKKEVIQ